MEGFFDRLRSEVAEDFDMSFCSGFVAGFGGVVFGVGAGEAGDEDLWCDFRF